MKARRITEITLETNETITIRRSANTSRIPCPQCGSQTARVTPDQAATLCRVGIRTIYREIEAGRLHFHESPSGSLLICLDSLQDSLLLRSGNPHLQLKPTKENPS